eukprot:scaffold217_cov60-Phaeocystis_antarctica.AAC.3
MASAAKMCRGSLFCGEIHRRSQGETGGKAVLPGAPVSSLDPLASTGIWPMQLRSSGLSDAMVCSNPAQYGTGSQARDASPGRLRLRLRGSSARSVAA